MIKRILEISSMPAYLSVRHKQLVVHHRDADKNEKYSYPLEDLAVVCVDQPQVSYSHQSMVEMLSTGTILVICGRNHMPAGLLLPFSTHAEIRTRLHLQLTLSKPRCKQLWQQIIRAKILAQATNLDDKSKANHLVGLARRVRSGDAGNFEAQAARTYWPVWLGPEYSFSRSPDSDDGINGMLNYGYAIIRAAVARSLVNAGLNPTLGIKHHHRSNAFALADDIMEPLRPLVDARVRVLVRLGNKDVNPVSKAALLDLLSTTVELNGEQGPLMIALPQLAASLARCMELPDSKLSLPRGTGEETNIPAAVLEISQP